MATGFSDLLAKFGAAPAAPLPPVPEIKKTEVQAKSQQKRAAMGGIPEMPSDEEFYNLSAARASGAGQSITDPMRRDILNGSIWDNLQSYGTTAGDIAGNASIADTAFRMDRNASVSDRGAIRDAATSVLGGFATGAASIGTLGLGLVSNKAGRWGVEKTEQLQKLIQDDQTPGLNVRRRAYAATNAIDMADNTDQYKKDLKTNSSFVAGLKRIGRDAYDAVSNAADDGMILSDGIANGVGSLLLGGPIAKGLSRAGSIALKGATIARPSLLLSEAVGKAASLGSKAAMPASIGLLESSGTYQQTYSDAMARLESRTDLNDDQKASMANKAALQAAAIQFPLAAATGVITSKFEASPFHVPTVRSAVGNLLKEAVEEGTQSATSQLATNQGIKDYVDPELSISEGVGEQLGLGALYGLGTAGVVQAPGAAGRAAINTATASGRAIARGVNSLVSGVSDRADNVRAQVEAGSPVASAQMAPKLAAAVIAGPEIQAEAAQSIQNSKAPEAQKSKANDALNKLFTSIQFDDSEADNQVSPVVGEAIRGSANKFEAIDRAANVAIDKEQAPEHRLAAGLYLLDTIRNNDRLEGHLIDAAEAMDDNDPALAKIQKFADTISMIKQNKEVQTAIKQAMEFENSITPDAVSDTNIGTPEGQQASQSAIQLASLAPERSNPEINNQILLHAEQGRILLTQDQRSFLEAARDLNQAEQARMDAGEKLGLTPSEIVSREIRSDKQDENIDKPLSAAEHVSRIFRAMRAGNVEAAKNQMERFTNFARGLQNKVRALNESLETDQGKKVSYETYNPRTGQMFSDGTEAFLNGRSENSIQNAQNVALDAKAVADIHSSLVRSFTGLGFNSIEQNELNPDIMNQPADKAARSYRERIQKAKQEAKRQTTADRLASDPRAQVEDKTLPVAQSENDAARPDQTSDEQSQIDREQTPDQVPQKAQDQEAEPQVEEVRSQSDPEPASLAPAEPEVREPVEAVEEKPEAKVAEASTSEKAETLPSMDVAYPNLLGSNKSIFKQVFTLPKEAISRLTNRNDSVKTIREALSSRDNFQKFIDDEKVSRKLKPEIVRAYTRYLNMATDLGKQMTVQLREKIASDKRLSDPNNITDEVLGYDDNRALAITDNIDGKIVYNQDLLQDSILAGLQWLISMDQRSRELKPEDVGKILGIPETDVTSDQTRLFNQGVYFGDTVTDLADTISRFWGLKSNQDAPVGFTRGVPEGVAKEVIRALNEMGAVKIETFDVLGKTYRQINFALKDNETFKNELYPQLTKFPDAIETAALVEPEGMMFIDRVPPKRGAYQLRNRNVPLTEQQQKMRDNEERTPHYANLPMINLMTALTESGAQVLFGHGDLSKQVLNLKHRESMESVNKGIAAAVEMMRRTMAELENTADGQELDQVPIRYAYDFTSVNRLQMSGRQNPQANKITRELFMPTRATLDLSDNNTVDMSKFMLGMAQAWGKKVHKQNRAASVQQVQDLVSGDYQSMIRSIQDWLNKKPAQQAIDGADLAEMIRATLAPKGGPTTPVAVYAAVEYARYLNDNDKSRFTTSLYVEADGVTDGPINALVHMARGSFTGSWLRTVRKGGLFIGQQDMTVNAFSQTDEGKTDLYQQTTNYLKNHLTDFENMLRGNTPLSNQLQALKELMGGLGLDMSINEKGELIIDRGAVKNPLTVKIYGAGDKGIANKISSLLIKAVYERESQILQDPKNDRLKAYRTLLGPIIDNRVLNDKDGYSLRTGNKTNLNNIGENFELSPEHIGNLSENIQQLYMPSMAAAIDQSIGETQHAVTLIQQATEVMSLVFRNAYLKGIQDKLDAKEKTADKTGWKRGYFLSPNELQEVYDANKYLAPYIQTGTQNILVGGSDRTALKTSENDKARAVIFSKSLDKKLSTEGYTTAPGQAGVSGIPFTVIATGDGQMMQTYSADYGGDGAKHLLIFDGANFSLDQVDQASRDINQAVHQGWMNNPFANVAEMFSSFMKNNIQLDTDMTKHLARALGIKGGSQDDVRQSLAELNENVQEISKEIQARKNVLARVGMSVDHMASAEAPYNAAGEDLSGLNDEEMIARLNEMRQEEYNKITDQKSEPVEDNTQPLAITEGNDLIRAVDRKDNFAQLIARRVSQLGYRMLTGQISDLAEHVRNETGLEVPSSGSNIRGFFSLKNKSIYLANASQETMLHEMIHAATIDQVHDFYVNDGQNLSSNQKTAIERIESLMKEWLDVSKYTGGRQSIHDARQTILGYLNDTSILEASRKTNAMSEFMAWNLSNQELIENNKRLIDWAKPIVRSFMEAFKSLISSLGLGNPNSNFYEDLRFHTAVLVQDSQPISSSLEDTVLYQSSSFGENDRITNIREQFLDKIARYINEQPNPVTKLNARQRVDQAKTIGIDISNAFEASGFLPDMQSKSTFDMVLTAFAANIQIDPNSMSRAEELYSHATKLLKVEDFMANREVDDPADRFQAQEKYNSILGTNLTLKDEAGRSTLFPAFLALSVVDEGFRSILAQMDLPKNEKLTNNSMDNILSNVGDDMMDSLGRLMAGEQRNTPSVGAAIDQMTDRLADISRDEKSWIAQFANQVGGLADSVNTWVTDQMTRLSEKADQKLSNTIRTTKNPKVKLASEASQILLGFINKDIASANAESIIQAANKYSKSKTINDFLGELVGRTESNASIYDMIKEVRSMVAAIRQRYRENLPKIIAKEFTRELADSEWTNLYNGLGKTDLAALTSGYSQDQIIELFRDPIKVTNERQTIESRIAKNSNGALLISKSRQLADYMNTGKVTPNLLRNAYAIERLFGEGIKLGEVDTGLVKDIDHLVSLHALEGLNQETKDSLSSLVQDENKGVKFVLSYLNGQRQSELADIQSRGDMALYNHYKGYIPSIQDGKNIGKSLIVASDNDYLKLRELGYERLSDYEGAAAEAGSEKRGYYYSGVSGRAGFSQGILQTVHTTVAGVDPVTGLSTSVSTAGAIVDPQDVQNTERRLRKLKGGNEQLMPVYDDQGRVTAYERSTDPNQMARLKRSTNVADMLGVWRGRQQEEALAVSRNYALIERLGDMWNKAEQVNKDEYINLYDKREQKLDPVMADAVRLIPREARSLIRSTFGDNQFWVRKDLLNNAIGYRKASVGDIWTGNTRFSEDTTKGIKNIATAAFGAQAYQYFVKAEKLLENFVSDAKATIVVRSVIVPVGNIVSNMYQLAANGVPIVNAVRAMPRKTAETEGYMKGLLRTIQIEAELRVARGAKDSVRERKLTTEDQGIRDGWKRLSIWPLIEAGELNSISDTGIGKEEIDLAEGRLGDYFQGIISKMPAGLKEVARQFWITNDTTLFKGLQKAVDYGDFLAKSVLYDDLVNRRKQTKEQALAHITEEFVNYNYLSGRTMDKADSMGVAWFWRFKVRSTKVALRMLRDNPVYALLSTLVPAPPLIGTVGSPLTDNILSVGLNGRLGYSIGPGQGLRAHTLNPWLNMLGI